MKSILLLSIASLAAAQNLSGEPACAVPCLSTAIAAVCTPASDQGCACASQSAIGNSAVSCLLASCNAADLIQAQSAGSALCVAYSATAGGASGSSGSSGIASETGTTTSGTAATETTSVTTTDSDSSTITSLATLTGTVSSSESAGSSASESASFTASSASSSAGAGQGSVAAGAGLLGMVLAGLMAL